MTAAFGFALVASARADLPEHLDDGNWHFSVTPYLWVPRIDGTLHFTTGSGNEPTVSITPINYLDNLNVPLMLAADVGKGEWSAVTDFVFVDFSGEKAEVTSASGPGGIVQVPIDTGSTVGLRGIIWTQSGGYCALHGQIATLDVLGGFRYFRVKSSLDWRFGGGVDLLSTSGSMSQSENLWDAIIAVRGTVQFGTGSNWSVSYHLDVGTGSSDVTWQAMVAAGYKFHWGKVLLDYRHLQYQAGDSRLIERLNLNGPGLGVSFHF